MAKRIVTYTPKRQRDGWTRYLRLIGRRSRPWRRPARRTRIRRPRRLVHLLLGHPLVDEARRTLRLVLRDVPSAGPPAGRSGLNQRPAGATAKADRAAAVILFPRLWRQTDLLPVCRIDLAEG